MWTWDGLKRLAVADGSPLWIHSVIVSPFLIVRLVVFRPGSQCMWSQAAVYVGAICVCRVWSGLFRGDIFSKRSGAVLRVPWAKLFWGPRRLGHPPHTYNLQRAAIQTPHIVLNTKHRAVDYTIWSIHHNLMSLVYLEDGFGLSTSHFGLK